MLDPVQVNDICPRYPRMLRNIASAVGRELEEPCPLIPHTRQEGEALLDKVHLPTPLTPSSLAIRSDDIGIDLRPISGNEQTSIDTNVIKGFKQSSSRNGSTATFGVSIDQQDFHHLVVIGSKYKDTELLRSAFIKVCPKAETLKKCDIPSADRIHSAP